MAFADRCSDMYAESVSNMSAANITTVDSGETLCFGTLYLVDRYLCRWPSRLEERRFTVRPARSVSTAKAGQDVRETVYVRWWNQWKHWSSRRAEDIEAPGRRRVIKR